MHINISKADKYKLTSMKTGHTDACKLAEFPNATMHNEVVTNKSSLLLRQNPGGSIQQQVEQIMKYF